MDPGWDRGRGPAGTQDKGGHKGRHKGRQARGHVQDGGGNLSTGAAERSISVDLFSPNEPRVTWTPALPGSPDSDAHPRYAKSPYPSKQHADDSDAESVLSDTPSRSDNSVRSSYGPLRSNSLATKPALSRNKFGAAKLATGLAKSSTFGSIRPIINDKRNKNVDAWDDYFDPVPSASRTAAATKTAKIPLSTSAYAITPKQKHSDDNDGEDDQVTPLLSGKICFIKPRPATERPDTPYPGEDSSNTVSSRSVSSVSSKASTMEEQTGHRPPEIHLEHHAQPPEYWTGRFVTMCDQLSNEQLEERNMNVIVSAHAAIKNAGFSVNNQQLGGVAGHHIPASMSGPAIAQSARPLQVHKEAFDLEDTDTDSVPGDLESILDFDSEEEETPMLMPMPKPKPGPQHAQAYRPSYQHQQPTFAPPPGADLSMGAMMGCRKENDSGNFRRRGADNNEADMESPIRKSPSRIPVRVGGSARPLPAIPPLTGRRIPHSNTSGAILENAPRPQYWPLLHESRQEDRVLRLPPPLTPRRQAMNPPEFYKPGAGSSGIGQAYTSSRPVYMTVATSAAESTRRTEFNFSTPRRISAAAARVAQMNDSHPHPLASNPVVLTPARTLGGVADRQAPSATSRAMLLADAFNLVDDDLRARRALLRMAGLCVTGEARYSFWLWQQDLARFTSRPSLLPPGGCMEEPRPKTKFPTVGLSHPSTLVKPAPKEEEEEEGHTKDSKAKKAVNRMSRIFGLGGSEQNDGRERTRKVEALTRHYEGLVAATGSGASARRRIFGAFGGGSGAATSAATSAADLQTSASSSAEPEGSEPQAAKGGSSGSFFSAGGGRRRFFGGRGGRKGGSNLGGNH